MFNTSPISVILASAFLVVLAGCASTAPPDVSPEGLVLQQGSNVDTLYLKPGATFKGYTEYGVTNCEVAFRSNWLRDQNSNTLDITNRVTQRDVDRIKDSLSEMCEAAFRAALAEEPAYKVVDTFDDGEQVLVLRPSIINLDISAPDIMGANSSRSYTTSAGEMTLVLELLDGTTNELLVRAIDKRRGTDIGRMQWTNSVTNRADADRALKHWASLLRNALDNSTAR